MNFLPPSACSTGNSNQTNQRDDTKATWPLDPDNAVEVAELRRQRMLCGWGLESVEKWLEMIRKGDRLMYWIVTDVNRSPPVDHEASFLEHLEDSPARREEIPLPNPDFSPAGHFALDWVDYLDDKTLADRNAGRITFASLYVLMSKQGQGYARIALQEAERIAKYELKCKSITLNTLPAHYLSDGKWWSSQGYKQPKNIPVYEEWYRSKGYNTYLCVPRHRYRKLDGTVDTIPCINMEKQL